jgi:hypothetical protein
MVRIIRGRKAYLHTLEAFFAFFMTFMFVIFIIFKGVAPGMLKAELNVLGAVEQRDDFRTCIYAGNTTCAENIVDSFIPSSYKHKIAIDAPAPFKGSKDIYTETVFMASNQTNDYTIVYLYYWFISG